MDSLETLPLTTSETLKWLSSLPIVIQKSLCFTSTEARWHIRDGDSGGGGAKSEGSLAVPPEKDQRDRGPPPEQWKC